MYRSCDGVGDGDDDDDGDAFIIKDLVDWH